MGGLVDYEDSKKDDQRWIDGSREGTSLANESGIIGKGPNESFTTISEASGQTTQGANEEVPVMGDLFDSANVRMSDMHDLLEANDPQDEVIDKVGETTVASTNDSLATSSTLLVEEGDITATKEPITEATWEGELI